MTIFTRRPGTITTCRTGRVANRSFGVGGGSGRLANLLIGGVGRDRDAVTQATIDLHHQRRRLAYQCAGIERWPRLCVYRGGA